MRCAPRRRRRRRPARLPGGLSPGGGRRGRPGAAPVWRGGRVVRRLDVCLQDGGGHTIRDARDFGPTRRRHRRRRADRSPGANLWLQSARLFRAERADPAVGHERARPGRLGRFHGTRPDPGLQCHGQKRARQPPGGGAVLDGALRGVGAVQCQSRQARILYAVAAGAGDHGRRAGRGERRGERHVQPYPGGGSVDRRSAGRVAGSVAVAAFR